MARDEPAQHLGLAAGTHEARLAAIGILEGADAQGDLGPMHDLAVKVLIDGIDFGAQRLERGFGLCHDQAPGRG